VNFKQRAERIRAIPTPAEFVIQAARNVLENAGVSEAEADGLLERYFARCEERLKVFEYSSLPAEVEVLAQALRGVAAPPRDEVRPSPRERLSSIAVNAPDGVPQRLSSRLGRSNRTNRW
jgi:hypothetical protein